MSLHSPLIISPPAQPRRLVQDLKDLLVHAAGKSLTIDEIKHALKNDGFAMLIMFMALPCVLPVNIPGFGFLFGIVIFIIGVRIALGQEPWLPQFVLRKEISHAVLEKIIHIGVKVCTVMEKITKQGRFFQRCPGMMNIIGVGIASGGLLLAQPAPIPLMNTFPAVAVVFLTAGMIERDGLLVLAGYLVNIFAWAYFWASLYLVKKWVMHFIDFFN